MKTCDNCRKERLDRQVKNCPSQEQPNKARYFCQFCVFNEIYLHRYKHLFKSRERELERDKPKAGQNRYFSFEVPPKRY